MSTSGFETQRDALRRDAKTWDDVSGVFDGSGRTAASLRVSPADLPGRWSTHEVLTAYADLQTLVSHLLFEGRAETSRAASVLRDVDRAYGGADDAAARDLRRAWTPKE